MNRGTRALAALTLTLALATPASSALASDFYTPSPVPSSRDKVQAKTTETKRTKTRNNTYILNEKIVKTTKPTEGTDTSARKVPGAL